MSQSLYKGRRVLWMPFDTDWRLPSQEAAICCEAMTQALAFDCDQHVDPFECADAIIIYNEVFDEYGIPVHDGGASYVLITHCPWCGVALPESQRDLWSDETEALASKEGDDLPAKYLTAAWRLG